MYYDVRLRKDDSGRRGNVVSSRPDHDTILKCCHSILLYLGIIKNVKEGHDVMKANTRIEALLAQCLAPSKPLLKC